MADENTGTIGIGANGLPLAPNVQTYSPETTITRPQETPQWGQAVGRQEKAYEDLATAAGAENEAKVNVAQQQADLYKAQATKEAIYLQEREARRAELNQRIQESHEDLRARIARASEDPKRYWDDKTSEQKTYARVGIILSAFGAGISGGNNKAIEYINNEIDRDVKLKQARAERLMKLAEQSRGMLSDAYRQRADELSDMDAQRAAGWDIVARQAEILAKTGLIPQMKAQGQAAVAAIQQKAAEARINAEENRKTQVVSQSAHTTTTEGLNRRSSAPTESEAKLSILGKSMQDELRAIREGVQLESSDLDQLQKDTLGAEAADKAAESGQAAGLGIAAGRWAGVTPKSRYSGLPAEKQKAANAWDNAVEKYARVLTGAGMPAEEARRMSRQNMPVAGDTPAVIDMKLKRLENEANRFVALSGPATESRLATSQPIAKPAPAQLTPRQALDMAKARLQADPNDKVARRAIEALKAEVGGAQ